MSLRKLCVSLAISLTVLSVPFSPVLGSGGLGIVEVRAESGLDDDLSFESTGENLGDDIYEESGSYDTGVADLFKNHRPMTPEQLEEASMNLSPVTDIIGSAMGIILVLVCSGIFLITALDLLYIGFPPVRGLLYRGAQDEMQGGGMMGGYGGMRGGYGGMGGMSGGAQRGLRFQIISDEAVQCSQLIGGSQQSAGGGMPGGYGGMAMNTPQNEMSNKSVVLVYFKKRVIFLVIFAICTVMLTSSLFIGTGVNLAQWLTNMVELFNESIPK